MNRQEALQAFLAGTQGTNPYIQRDTEMQLEDKKANLAKYLKAQEPVIAGQKATAEDNAHLQTLQRPEFQDLVNDGGSAKAGDLSVGGNPYARMAAQMGSKKSAEAARIAGYAKNNIKPLEDQLSTLDLYHQLLDNPNSFDQKKLQVLGARLVEGPGQRLLDSVVQAMGADKSTLAGDAQSKWNYFTGKAKSGLTPDQVNAMRDTAFKYQNELGPKYEDARNQFNAYVPQLGADIEPTALDNISKSTLAAGNRMYDGLGKRYQDYSKASQGKTTLNNPQPIYREPDNRSILQKAIDSGKTGLSALFGGGSSQPAQAPQSGGLPSADAIQAELARRKAAQVGSQ